MNKFEAKKYCKNKGGESDLACLFIDTFFNDNEFIEKDIIEIIYKRLLPEAIITGELKEKIDIAFTQKLMKEHIDVWFNYN